MATTKEILVPDIGGATDVDVIEILVAPGDKVKPEDSLITLEGDKATMEVPSPLAGTVDSVKVKIGDKVSEGSLILLLKVEEAEVRPEETKEKPTIAEPVKEISTPERIKQPTIEPSVLAVKLPSFAGVYAGPAVRRIAREFGIDLTKIAGSGDKGRITKTDIQNYVKQAVSGQAQATGFGAPSLPKIDFSQFGEVEIKPLTKINKLTGVNVCRSWASVPHVTQLGKADITEMEAFRQEHKKEAEKQGFKLTPLVFIMKAVVTSLQQFPQFNASLDETGENLVLKHYFHIGVAVDTPNGLVVPVIRDVDQKSLLDLAKELSEMSKKTRETGLSMNEMSGSCFTISSLGGIGGTAFTPIIKVPDVAILGVSKAAMEPVYQDGEFMPRLMLPLSLSYDHRVIDGATGARFIVHLCTQLSDIKNWLL